MDSLDLTQAIPPLLTLNDGAPEFDYTAFLNDQEIDYLAEDNSSSSSATLALSATSSNSSPPTARSPQNSAQKHRHERRGHTKSRRGCYNCKRRRIKCQETRPACGHCLKTGLQCEYPATPQVIHQPQHQIPLFSLQDMRLFQHFLITSVPRHPLGNESIWTHEVPCLSQNHEYLMHAILGLAAAELMAQDRSLISSAIAHRLKAIKAIKKALADPTGTDTYEHGNALMATCFALTFQSVMIDDGMAEFMTFCRGVMVVAVQMVTRGFGFMFRNFFGDDQMAVLEPLMQSVPPINTEWTDRAVEGIRALAPLCTHAVETKYQAMLMEIAEALYTSPFTAYKRLCDHYGWWIQLPHEDFAHLVNPNNAVCTLLGSHWIALKQIGATVTEREFEARPQEYQEKDEGMDLGMIRWLRYLNRQVEPEYQQYNQWPVWVEAQLKKDLRFFGKYTHSRRGGSQQSEGEGALP